MFVLAYVCRKEEFDFFLAVKKSIAGKKIASNMPYEKLQAASVPKYGGIPNDLGDKLMEFEFVESLIERGTLVPENEDGTQFKLVIC
ncbi:Hypp8868 [Branchiostoma lanceolatum]|uniref:Hypp8868 protein n=1 Tax=Branchiostoma lanceolatum TaxID=7740 RepID=A0A8J9ZA40_BRALA|nr:Hypp8868 [Branchiostoma lanceolatum]